MRVAALAAAVTTAVAAVMAGIAAPEGRPGERVAAGDGPPRAGSTLTLEPEACRIEFTLGATMHTVTGSFRLLGGRLETAPGGALTGSVVVDATSGETGNARRDRKMHREVLESDRHPRIVFRPRRLEGSLPAAGDGTVRVEGEIEIRGVSHPLSVEAAVRIDGDRLEVRARFRVPFVAWGMPDPSVFLLRVEKEVDVSVALAGTLGPPPS